MNEVLLLRKEFLTTVDNYQRARKCSKPERLRVTDARLREFDLRDIDLTEIDFENCDLSGANLSGAKLMGSCWANCQFGLTNLTDVQLQGATFGSGCSFEGTTLNRCAANRASFSASNFQNAKAVDAHFGHVDFGSSRLANMDLTRASLDNASNYLLDHAIVRDTGFSADANDPWSKLRRTYTGPRFVLNLLLLVTFVLFLVVKGFAYQILVLIEAAPGLADGIEAYCQISACRNVRISDVLLGFQDGAAFFVISSLVYNLLRFVLTFGVSALREQEERSGRSPAYDPPPMLDNRRRIAFWFRHFRQYYRWMHGVHRWLMFPLWIVVMISFFQVLHGLATEVIQLPIYPQSTAAG